VCDGRNVGHGGLRVVSGVIVVVFVVVVVDVVSVVVLHGAVSPDMQL